MTADLRAFTPAQMGDLAERISRAVKNSQNGEAQRCPANKGGELWCPLRHGCKHYHPANKGHNLKPLWEMKEKTIEDIDLFGKYTKKKVVTPECPHIHKEEEKTIPDNLRALIPPQEPE